MDYADDHIAGYGCRKVNRVGSLLKLNKMSKSKSVKTTPLIKPNGKGGKPAKTGKKSGKGRDNNPPKR